jgi:hypothetical protein
MVLAVAASARAAAAAASVANRMAMIVVFIPVIRHPFGSCHNPTSLFTGP